MGIASVFQGQEFCDNLDDHGHRQQVPGQMALGLFFPGTVKIVHQRGDSSNSAAQSYQICHSEERSDVGISCNSPRIRRGFPTIRLCTAEIAASACGLLAMTNLKALHQ